MNNAAEMLALLDKHLPDPTLGKVGLTPERVRALTAPPKPSADIQIAPADARRALARAFGKMNHGATPLPAYVVGAMHADYVRLGSLRKVGELYDRDGTTMGFILKKHGFEVKKRGGANHVTPANEVAAMRNAYKQLRSLRKVGALCGRDGSTLRTIFRNHGLPINPRGRNTKAA